MNKLVESTQILIRFAREMGYRNQLIVDFEFPTKDANKIIDKDLTLLNSLFYMTVIDSVSFLDEYQQVYGVKTETKYKDRIKITKAINKPLISKICEWKDLRDFRNNLLAHNLRKGKNGNFVFSIENLDYNAPRNLNDLFLLTNLIQLSTDTIYSEFENEIKEFASKITKEIKVSDRLLTKDDVSKITTELLKKANLEKTRHNRDYSFRINSLIDWNKV